MPGLPDVTIPTRPGVPWVAPPFDIDIPPWEPIEPWYPEFPTVSECWTDWTIRFMALVETVGAYRMSVGLPSMLPWWDLRVGAIMADVDIVNTAIEWLRFMWNGIVIYGADGGGGETTMEFALDASSQTQTSFAQAPYIDGSTPREARAELIRRKRFAWGNRLLVAVKWSRATHLAPNAGYGKWAKLSFSNRNGTASRQDVELEMPTMGVWYLFDLRIDDTTAAWSITRNGAAFTAGTFSDGPLSPRLEVKLRTEVWAGQGDTYAYVIGEPDAEATVYCDGIIHGIDAALSLDGSSPTTETDDEYESDADAPPLVASNTRGTDAAYAASITVPYIPVPIVEGTDTSVPQAAPLHLSDLDSCSMMRAWLYSVEIAVYRQIRG